jgi:hypothetical protein
MCINMVEQLQFFESTNFYNLETLVNKWLSQKREKPIAVISVHPANYVDISSRESNKLRHTMVIRYEYPDLDTM